MAIIRFKIIPILVQSFHANNKILMKSKKEERDTNSKEKIIDLKKQTVVPNSVHKGYNEKNPTQPEGAFKPDSKK